MSDFFPPIQSDVRTSRKYNAHYPSATEANHCPPRHNRVLRNYGSENESKAYDLLHNETPFGSGAQKMTEEFAEMQGKNVEGFSYEAKASGVFHFSIFF